MYTHEIRIQNRSSDLSATREMVEQFKVFGRVFDRDFSGTGSMNSEREKDLFCIIEVVS